jgi:hypothetical protein
MPSLTPTQAPTVEVFPAIFIRNIIRSEALEDGREFFSSSNYQSRALEWMMRSDIPVTVTDTQLIQRYSLACLYYATSPMVSPWESDRNWLSDESVCQWYGIECNEEGLVDRILLVSYSHC